MSPPSEPRYRPYSQAELDQFTVLREVPPEAAATIDRALDALAPTIRMAPPIFTTVIPKEPVIPKWSGFRIQPEQTPVVRPLAHPCPTCGQVPDGQGGEYPCRSCGLPTVHDDPICPRSSTADATEGQRVMTAARDAEHRQASPEDAGSNPAGGPSHMHQTWTVLPPGKGQARKVPGPRHEPPICQGEALSASGKPVHPPTTPAKVPNPQSIVGERKCDTCGTRWFPWESERK